MSICIKDKIVKCIHKNGIETIFLGSNALEAAHNLKEELSDSLNPVVELVVK